MKSVLSNQPVESRSQHIPKLVDHRYFYDTYDSSREAFLGYYTCGLAAKAIGTTLLATSNMRFADTAFLASLPKFINNPSVSGFMIEQAVLSSIALNGLSIRNETNCLMEVKVFDGPTVKFDPGIKKPILYIPFSFNFKGIDGLIACKEQQLPKKKSRLLLLPLQITIASKHKDSRKTFFNDWKKWIVGLEESEVVPEFIWITAGQSVNIHHKSNKRGWPAHDERKITLSGVSHDIARAYNAAKSGKNPKS
jgi:hypothetical protein